MIKPRLTGENSVPGMGSHAAKKAWREGGVGVEEKEKEQTQEVGIYPEGRWKASVWRCWNEWR